VAPIQYVEAWGMENMKDFFLCSNCENKNFSLVYNFSLRFHGVNFSDDLIYDSSTEELYECTECRMTFTKRQIEEGLTILKKKRKEE
jgi:hypothetical protein